MANVRSFLGVARAPFLLLPVTLVACGAAASAYEGHFSWRATLLALVGLLLLHAAVNVLNEVSDVQTGIDFHTLRTPFSGGSGTLPAGQLHPVTARRFGLTCAALGALIGVYFLTRIGWPLLPIMVVGAVAVLGYTDFLARRGFGELFAGLGLGALPVWGTALVQGATPREATLAASLPAFFMTFNLLLLNEFPDEVADRAGGRSNLVLLFGRRPAAVIYTVAACAVPIVIVAAVAVAVLPPLALVAVAPSALLVLPLRWAMTAAEAEVPVPALAANVAWNLATNTFLAVALAVAAR